MQNYDIVCTRFETFFLQVCGHNGFSGIIVPSFRGSRSGPGTGSEPVREPFGMRVWDPFGTGSPAAARFFRSREELRSGRQPPPSQVCRQVEGSRGAEPPQETFDYVPIGYYYPRGTIISENPLTLSIQGSSASVNDANDAEGSVNESTMNFHINWSTSEF